MCIYIYITDIYIYIYTVYKYQTHCFEVFEYILQMFLVFCTLSSCDVSHNLCSFGGHLSSSRPGWVPSRQKLSISLREFKCRKQWHFLSKQISATWINMATNCAMKAFEGACAPSLSQHRQWKPIPSTAWNKACSRMQSLAAESCFSYCTADD